MKRDLRVQWQMFLGIAVFVSVIDAVYWFVSYERAGTTMLTLAAGLAAFCGSWLFVQDHRRHETHETYQVDETNQTNETSPAGAADRDRDHARDEERQEHYLPTASLWPLVIATGLVLGLNGLILSWPYAVPGGVVLMLGVAGFVGDSRTRA